MEAHSTLLGMSEQFTVRRATSEDTDLVMQMIREMATAERKANAVTITAGALERYVFGERPIAEVFLGYWENEPVAYLMLQHRFSSYSGTPVVYVEDVFVRARSRGQGLGKLMMAFAAGYAVEHKYGALHWSVLDWNTPAIQFYDRLGATRESGRLYFDLTGVALQRLAQGAPKL
jgi:GNAT superfamily N-acetyltransferase